MSNKKKSLSQKSINMLIVLGLILFVGTGLAGGIQLYKQNLKTVQTSAQSYVCMLCLEAENSNAGEMLSHQQAIRDIYKQYAEHFQTSGGVDIDAGTYEKILKSYGEEAFEMSRLWSEVNTFVVGFGNLCQDIETAYVVVPEENKLIYIWDSDIKNGGENAPFERGPYTGKEKERIMAVMNGDIKTTFFTDSVKGELVGTMLAPVYDRDGKICAVAAIDTSISSIRKASLMLLFNIGLIILLIMLVSITLYHYVLRKQVIIPIRKISDSMIRFSKDSRTKPEPLNIRSGDEIAEIAESYEKMTEDISSYITNIEELTRERIQNNVELEVARRIQYGLVPEQCFLEDEGYRIHAMTSPAKAVGGDFYDCFQLDESSVCIVMGDVSGKGITAAIFMAMVKTIIREKLLAGLSPADVLYQANNEMCKQNPECLFATAFAAVLNLQTGELRYANAGHTLPVMLKKEPEYLQVDSGIAIGLMEDAEIRDDTLQLSAGEGILLYTDGVTEAMNRQKEFFGTARLLDAVREKEGDNPDEDDLIRIRRAVSRFTEGCEPFDDLAVLVLYRTGGSS